MAKLTRNRPLFRHAPGLQVPWASLGTWPTPVQPLLPNVWVKRDDLSASDYGGNKVRTLEPLLATAASQGAREVIATGAYGSNHAIATLVHAPKLGLRPGMLLFPQPPSPAAQENFAASWGSHRSEWLLHWSTLPFAMWAQQRSDRFVMPPGGASPLGALGYVSAALELAEQDDLPRFRRIVLPVGSTCTSAGLLLGCTFAERLGLLPRIDILGVRISPWPVTAKFRIVNLAEATGRLLASKTGDARWRIPRRALSRRLRVDASQLGRGYGHPTEAAHNAIERLGHAVTLDTTYSAKAAATLLSTPASAPTLYWATKSAAPAPALLPSAPSLPNGRLRRWVARSHP